MSILSPAISQEDDVFAAFASGQELRDEFVRSEELPNGVHALSSHGVTVALRSDRRGVMAGTFVVPLRPISAVTES